MLDYTNGLSRAGSAVKESYLAGEKIFTQGDGFPDKRRCVVVVSGMVGLYMRTKISREEILERNGGANGTGKNGNNGSSNGKKRTSATGTDTENEGFGSTTEGENKSENEDDEDKESEIPDLPDSDVTSVI